MHFQSFFRVLYVCSVAGGSGQRGVLMVKLRGLPYSVREADIYDFLRGVKIPSDGVLFLYQIYIFSLPTRGHLDSHYALPRRPHYRRSICRDHGRKRPRNGARQAQGAFFTCDFHCFNSKIACDFDRR